MVASAPDLGLALTDLLVRASAAAVDGRLKLGFPRRFGLPAAVADLSKLQGF